MTASFRAGSIALAQRPRLSMEALATLKYEGLGPFLERFGDYYIAGYRLGGDAGFMLSESKSSSKTVEALSVTVSARALVVKVSKTHKKFFNESHADSSFRIHGFDTLEALRIPPGIPVSAKPDLELLVGNVKDLERKCIKLAQRVTEAVEATGLSQGEEVGWETLEKLLRTNLVVEVILLPMRTLREVKTWAMSRDIITITEI